MFDDSVKDVENELFDHQDNDLGHLVGCVAMAIMII